LLKGSLSTITLTCAYSPLFFLFFLLLNIVLLRLEYNITMSLRSMIESTLVLGMYISWSSDEKQEWKS
jgi:hypothetical protein